MFKTVRHWWRGEGGKTTARLFVFELFVVVAGVLIAQALAGYVQTQSELARMESERSRIRYELASTHSGIRSWAAAVPCLDSRMTEVMTGTAIGTSALHRPRFPTPSLTAPTTEILDLIARRYGVEEKDRLNWIAENTANASRVIASIISRWGRLIVIDPQYGSVTSTDYSEARLAAADIKAELRAMEVLSTDSNAVLAKMKIVPRNQNEPAYGPAKTCAAIWKSGRLDPPLATR
ncbi:hypothetical protein [Sphingomonas sp.]|uniref:hypothetical protein n=1 Tax=Sphingomonas sp. TaxID=28214 RepID=UPI00286BE3AE|nr:hypothetical protein [Sphingomonas sp.]